MGDLVRIQALIQQAWHRAWTRPVLQVPVCAKAAGTKPKQAESKQEWGCGKDDPGMGSSPLEKCRASHETHSRFACWDWRCPKALKPVSVEEGDSA